MAKDTLVEAMIDGKTTIKLKDMERPLTHTILAFPYRDYFIKRVKAPLEKALMLYAKKYPEPTKRNCSGKWTIPLMEASDKLVDYVQFKKDLFIAIRRIALGEIEHDNLYRDPILAMLEWLVEDILDGKLAGRDSDCPPNRYWSEPKPYGGDFSIINRIRKHRKEICDLIGRKYIE